MASRYTRQIRLAEVGAAGQARLEAVEISLSCSGEAGKIEARYLEAAGARRVIPHEGPEEHVLPFELRDPAAREVARGAHAALASLRRVWLGEIAGAGLREGTT